jgi:hypothetical protein
LDPRPRTLPCRLPGAPAGQRRGNQLRLAHRRPRDPVRPVSGAPWGHSLRSCSPRRPRRASAPMLPATSSRDMPNRVRLTP